MAEEYERLVVLIEARLDQFEKQMVRAEKRGTATYQKLQEGAYKASTAMERQFERSLKAQGRALDSVFGQTVEGGKRAAKSAEVFARDLDKAERALNQLRASVDPAFAATLRYEEAVKQLNDALKKGVITETQHRQVLDQVSVAYLKGGQAAGAHTGMLGALGTMSDSTKAKLQNAGFQVQDVAVQMIAGTDATRALAMQLPQLLGGFGLLGVVLGTLTSIGLPLLASWMGDGAEGARDFDAALGDVTNSISAMNEQAAIYTAEGLVALKEKYGELNFELLRFVDLQTEAMQRQALADTAASMSAIMDEIGEGWKIIGNLSEMFEGAAGQVNHLVWAMEDVKSARTFEDQLAAVVRLKLKIEELTGGIESMTDEQFVFYQEVLASEDALRQLVADQPKQGWLSAAIGAAETLAGKLWDAVAANAELSLDAAGNPIIPGTKGKRPRPAPSGEGGVDWGLEPETGGGAGAGGGSGRIDSLIAELQTERETIAAWYAESLTLLNGSTDAELAAVGGKHGALERLEIEHQERLKGIRNTAQTGTLADMDTFFGGMASLTKAGGERMLGAHRAFSAAQGVINSYTAFTEVLKDPSFVGRPWARFGAAAAALSSGLSAVASIRSGGGGRPSAGGSSGGGGSGASSADAAGNSTGPLRASITPLDPSALFTGASVRKLLDGLQEEAGNRGIILGWHP